MAIHVADAEVTRLLNTYASQTGMTKTEALRRLLRNAIEQENKKSRKSRFREVAHAIAEKNRQLHLPPITKEEQDAIFE